MTFLRVALPVIVLLAISITYVSADKGTVTVQAGKPYEIAYDIKDVKILDVTANQDETELIFQVDVTSPAATIEITIPRQLLDSIADGKDTDFFVIADGDLVTFSEKKPTDTTRTLFVQLSQGTKELEVFGTQLGSQATTQPPAESKPAETPKQEVPPSEKPTEKQPVEEKPATTPEETKQTPSQEEKSPEKISEQPVQSTEKKGTPFASLLDFKHMPNLSVDVDKKQLIEFGAVGAIFVGFAIAIGAIYRARKKKTVP